MPYLLGLKCTYNSLFTESRQALLKTKAQPISADDLVNLLCSEIYKSLTLILRVNAKKAFHLIEI